MTESTPEVEIHEFSTGIRYLGTANHWVLLGFTGQYMNVTIDPIPYAVERSIANKEFAVAEGASSDEPAVIGRVVGRGEDACSVVAIVTRGRGDYQRSALYRYFLCEGNDSLPKIMAWIEDYRQRNGQMPVFNPFEIKVVAHFNSSRVFSLQCQDLNPDIQSRLESETAPLIIQPGQQRYTLEQINKLATEKAKTNNQLAAWAFNVEALEQLRGFQIILAASATAYDLLQKAKINTPELPTTVVDEQEIKSAIKSLINSSTAKPKYVESIANSLINNEITTNYWRDIFDSQGANNALKEGIYSPQMVRLLMLRAIAMPETLPEYLSWLEKGNKQNNNYKVATEFDAQLNKCFSEIYDKETNIEIKVVEGLVIEGIQILLPSLLNQKVSLEAVNKLLTSDNGLWKKFSGKFIDVIEYDLESINKIFLGLKKKSSFQITDTSWHNIRRELQVYWRNGEHIYLEQYQPFAELFFNLNRPKLSTFFCHVGYGKVQKKIFSQLQTNGWNTEVYGVFVQREVTGPELLWLTIIKIGSKIVPVAIVIPIVLLSLLLGIGLRGYIPTNFDNAESDVQSCKNNKPENKEKSANKDTKNDTKNYVDSPKDKNTDNCNHPK